MSPPYYTAWSKKHASVCRTTILLQNYRKEYITCFRVLHSKHLSYHRIIAAISNCEHVNKDCSVRFWITVTRSSFTWVLLWYLSDGRRSYFWFEDHCGVVVFPGGHIDHQTLHVPHSDKRNKQQCLSLVGIQPGSRNELFGAKTVGPLNCDPKHFRTTFKPNNWFSDWRTSCRKRVKETSRSIPANNTKSNREQWQCYGDYCSVYYPSAS